VIKITVQERKTGACRRHSGKLIFKYLNLKTKINMKKIIVNYSLGDVLKLQG